MKIPSSRVRRDPGRRAIEDRIHRLLMGNFTGYMAETDERAGLIYPEDG